MRLLGRLIATIAVGVLAIAIASPAQADHNGAWLPVYPTFLTEEVLNKGYYTYDFDTRAKAYPGFVAQVVQSAESLHSVVGIYGRRAEPGERPDVIHTMPDIFPCDDAAACVYYASPPPVVIAYNYRLGYVDWRTAISHEMGHAFTLHEQYNDSTNIGCTRQRWTVMDCGSGQWEYTDWDRDRIWNALVPDRPRDLYLVVDGGWATVRWNDCRADGGAAARFGEACNLHMAGKYVAFAWSATPQHQPIWVGEVCGIEYAYCNSSYTDYKRGFDSYWQGCLYARAENAVLWWVKQVSAERYWSLVGCWGDVGANATVNAFIPNTGLPSCLGWYESNFNPMAVGGAGERGVMQIHPIHFGYGVSTSRGFTWDDMFNPVKNTQFARIISGGYDYTPWSTYQGCKGI